MKMRLFFADIIFVIHLLIGAAWWGLFLVPPSVWPEKIAFHFFLTLLIVGHQFVWGLLIMPWTHRFRTVCILTTPMQLLRGQKISDPKNYNHSWLKELAGKNGIRITHETTTIINFTILVLVSLQYFSSH